ncbi:MAG TPA: glycosyl hydrolase [Candidatus Sulfotelmatobacter sp.]|nr:glycosyl hydrolase [Candidatus Sulfotelmatobacter sp.]
MRLRVDITLGSGWPFGGPHIPITQAAGEMRVETVTIPSEAKSIPVPNIIAGEQLMAAFWIPHSPAGPVLRDAKQIAPAELQEGRLRIPPDVSRTHTVVFFISSRTGMAVKRPAVGAEGFVLDHYDQHAIENHLHTVGDRLLQAFADQPPYAVFSDSLEVNESDWTPDLLREFQRRRGYDLVPHLPALIEDAGPKTTAVRHDWGKTLTELANEHYLEPLQKWAQQHHTLLRAQTYGTPPVTLSSNQYVDLPEGEGKASLLMWRQFSDTRWAASAGHLLNKPVISSETWTWLHSPAFRATPLDMKAEADLHFLQGINQLIGHGWPYSPESAGEPGWRMYAAGALNAHNPWWFAMPDLAAYLQRVSFALRQGKPANDVAVLLPNDDAWADFTVDAARGKGSNTREGGVSIDESMPKLLGDKLIPGILDAGFNFDFIDADAIDKLSIQYLVLILPGVERLPVGTYRKIEQYVLHGGIVIATRRLPSTAPGLLHADAETREIRKISQLLFQSQSAPGHFVEDETQVGTVLANSIKPDLTLSPAAPEIGFIHRRLGTGDLYFIANTSNRPHSVIAKFRQAREYAENWNPFTGMAVPLANAGSVELSLEPYESRLIFFTSSKLEDQQSPSANKSAAAPNIIDLSADWNVTFKATHQTLHITSLHSWSDEEAFKYYSGQVAYEKTIELSDAGKHWNSAVLDFGEGTPVPQPVPLPAFNLRAYLEGPIREAADVYVNGQHAGVVWHPPYSIDVTSSLREGKNDLRILVGNTAINEMAGQSLPDYRLLNDRYGQRFVPQDMDHLQPLPSGLVGEVKLRLTR